MQLQNLKKNINIITFMGNDSSFSLMGDWARYPFKHCNKLLVTASIVVADIKETKPQSISTTAVFLCRPIL